MKNHAGMPNQTSFIATLLRTVLWLTMERIDRPDEHHVQGDVEALAVVVLMLLAWVVEADIHSGICNPRHIVTLMIQLKWAINVLLVHKYQPLCGFTWIQNIVQLSPPDLPFYWQTEGS